MMVIIVAIEEQWVIFLNKGQFGKLIATYIGHPIQRKEI